MQKIVTLLAGLACAAPLWAQTSEEAADKTVPIAHVPDPDLDGLQVMAMWQQILPDPAQHSGPAPVTELRYVLHHPKDKVPDDACRPDGLTLVGASAAPGQRATLSGWADNRTQIYEATVCTAALDPAAAEIGVMLNGSYAALYHDPRFYDDQPAPVARMPGPAVFGSRTPGGLRAVFLSDSGCRGQDGTDRSSRFWQDCSKITPEAEPGNPDWTWPLNAHSWDAVAQAPDFVLHGGDYHYYFEKESYWQSGKGATARLEYWFQEFLLPAQPLLLAAPLAPGRGNHEVCATAWFGAGWLALFGPTGIASCDGSGAWGLGMSLDSWSFTVAPRDGSLAPYTVWMIDSANTFLAKTRGVYDAPGTTGRDKLWVTHYPPVKNEYYNLGGRRHIGDESNLAAVNAALGECTDSGDCWPDLVLSGHQHLYQHLSLTAVGLGDAVRSDVHIAGHGGVRMDADGLPAFARNEDGLRGCKTSFAGRTVLGRTDMAAETQTASAYGYLLLTRDAAAAGGWQVMPRWYLAATPLQDAAGSCDVFPK
ncbi:metallophosphoesterase [Thalassococcus sp. BH17M4-6]|uniref:metallophosphoesterase n=1 Tax=Thalassococcus sp. BH17M4-6 TaxID=3413148 RepID=UPI003BC96223